MDRADIVQVALEYFPHSFAALLTGSQADKLEFNTTSDIDILVFDPIYIYPTSKVISVGDFRVDFTIFPACNLVEDIAAESGSAKGIVLTMIATSEILYDVFSMMDAVKDYVRQIRAGGSPLAEFRMAGMQSELKKIAHKIKGELDEGARVLMLCQAISTLASLEVIRETSWDGRPLQVNNLLMKSDPGFIQQYVWLFNKCTRENDLTALKDYIYVYIQHFRKKNLAHSEYLTFDLAIPGFSIPVFFTHLYPEIRKDDLLNKLFQYAYVPPERHRKLYKHDICIVFREIESVPDTVDMLDRLGKICAPGPFSHLRYQIISNPSGFDCKEEKLLFQIAQAIFVRPEMPMEYMAAYLCQSASSRLGLNTPDFEKINELLMQKFLITRDEQDIKEQYVHLGNLVQKKKRNLALAMRKSRKRILAAMEIIARSDIEGVDQLLRLIGNPSGYFPPGLGELAVDGEILKMIQVEDLQRGLQYLYFARKVWSVLPMSNQERLLGMEVGLSQLRYELPV